MNKGTKVNFHQTLLTDMTQNQTFTYGDVEYKMPADAVTHYHPSFWRLDVRLATFFMQHQIWATFFDWFNMRKRAIFEIGFLYDEGNPEPYTIKAPEYDWALENWFIANNTTVEGHYKATDNVLAGKQDHFSALAILIGIIVAVVAIVSIIVITRGGGIGASPPIQNVTASDANSTLAPAIAKILMGVS